MKCKSLSKNEWRSETAVSNSLFAEADRLNEIAYNVLNDRPTSVETVKRFQLAKDAANAKYEEAHRAWEIAKEHLKKVETSAKPERDDRENSQDD